MFIDISIESIDNTVNGDKLISYHTEKGKKYFPFKNIDLHKRVRINNILSKELINILRKNNISFILS